MAKFLMLLLVTVGIQAAAQTYPVTSITISLPANPDANTANWGSGTSQLNITANTKSASGRVDGLVQESKILVIIKKGNGKVCGSYTAASAPAANFNTLTKIWSGSNAASLIGKGCMLPAGEYELSVQFFGNRNGASIPLSEEKTKTFSIRGDELQAYQVPQPLLPANATILSEADAKKPITFRWTPVIPRPRDPVTYRLKVWQLMQGQNGTQARTLNQPILNKDIGNLTQTAVNNLLTGPCKPPYLCDFVWNVQALNRDGKPIGGNNGTSETFAFSMASGGCVANLAIKSVGCGELVNGKYKYAICATYTADAANTCNIAYNDAQNAAINSLTGHSLANLIKDANGGTVSGITFIPGPANVLTPGQSVQVCFTLLTNQPTANLVTYGLCKDGKELIAPNFANDAAEVELKPCGCTFCDEFKEWKFEEEKVTASLAAPFTVTLSSMITSPNIQVMSLKAELISFVHNGKQEECFGCNKDPQSFGNFTEGTFGSWGNGVFPLSGTQTTHHTLSWFSASGALVNLSGSMLSVTFTAPPVSPLSCCDDEIKFCIRYSFTDKECRTCSFVKCYEVIRKH